MSLSDISIKRPVFAWMLMAGLIVFGLISFSMMGISQLPDVDFPVVNIRVTWEGAAPDVMESAVADVIEDAVMSVDGIMLVQSFSQQGMTQISIQFNLDQDVNAALLMVQTRLSMARFLLPTTIDPPILTKTNPNDQPILSIAVYKPKGTLRDVVIFVRDHLKDEITTIPGVGDIWLQGYADPQMRIWLDSDKMAKHEITEQDVWDAVNAQHQLEPTGYQDTAATETYVRLHSEFKNGQQCSDLIIPRRSGGGWPNYAETRIRDVGYCVEDTDEVRRFARYNSIQPTVAVGVIKSHGTNAVQISKDTQKKVDLLNEIIPDGMKMGIITDTTVFIKESIDELIHSLINAVGLTAVVCYLFLGTFSSAFNVVLAIPVSLIGTFTVLNALGFTLNSFTLMGLSLSIGIVVDDAIMVLENITRHYEMGKSRVHAALVGSREITGAAIAASLAILAIFIPVVFMQGIVGKFFYQFGVTMSVAVMISLLEALTLAPMRCSQFLTVGGGNRLTNAVSRFVDWLAHIYKTSLRWCLKWRWTVLILAVSLFVSSLFTIPAIRKEFLPPQDQSRFLITIYTPMGASLDFTDKVFHAAEEFFRTRPEIASYYVTVGGSGGGLVNQGNAWVTLKPIGKRPFGAPFTHSPTQQEYMPYIREQIRKIPGVDKAMTLDLSLTGFSAQRGFPIEFELQGPDWDKLAQIAVSMRDKLLKSGYMPDVDTDYYPAMPETEVYPDREKAYQHGVPVTTVAQAISVLVGGLKMLPNRYTDKALHRDDIQIKLLATRNERAEDLDRIWVRNMYEEMIPLSQLVSLKPSSTLLQISRYNRNRGINIFGNPAKNKSQAQVMDYVQALGKQMLPRGYHILLSGNSLAFKQAFDSLIGALSLGIFVAFMVLASQFNSFLHPAVILLALPFSLTGALWSMRATDTSMNIYSLIGILLLMGIVKKNSILLVEFTNHMRGEGHAVDEALVNACPIRLRPILMTSIATITGAIPEALSKGAGSEVMKPMAITVIGGVTVSTFLTLFVVPCAYSLASRWEQTKHGHDLKEALRAMGELTDDHGAHSPADLPGHGAQPGLKVDADHLKSGPTETVAGNHAESPADGAGSESSGGPERSGSA